MKIRCTNKKCLHEWNYKGGLSDDKDYITCPLCRYKSMLKKAISGGKNIPLPSKFTDPLTHNKEKFTDLLTDLPKNSKYIEEGEDEEEFEEQESLFSEPIKKLCIQHNLPAHYSDFNKKWLCDKCRFPTYKNTENQPTIIFKNILHANPPNIEYVKDQIRNNNIRIPREEGFEFMPVEVSDPLGKNGKRIVMKKYKEVTSHLGTGSEMKSNFEINQIPFSLPINKNNYSLY